MRGPERHDSASLRVTTAPYALLMTITPLKYFRRWGGGAPIVSSPWVSSCARRPSLSESSVAVQIQGGCVSAHAAVIATVQAPAICHRAIAMLCSSGACWSIAYFLE